MNRMVYSIFVFESETKVSHYVERLKINVVRLFRVAIFFAEKYVNRFLFYTGTHSN